MRKSPSFSAIEHFSEIIEQNELFSQSFSDELTTHYDSNFIQLHFSPTLEEFLLLEKLQIDYQQSVNQDYLNFHWPDNTGIYIDVMDYLSQQNYKLGKLELFHIFPEQFIGKNINPKIQLSEVSNKTLETFLTLNYKEDLNNGEKLAKDKQQLYRYQFTSPHTKFLMASLNKEIVGSILLIESKQYIEIDNVLTDQNFRKLGVATTLLKEGMNRAKLTNKEVILVADAEDSPREMYERLGFQSVATQILAQKIL